MMDESMMLETLGAVFFVGCLFLIFGIEFFRGRKKREESSVSMTLLEKKQELMTTLTKRKLWLREGNGNQRYGSRKDEQLLWDCYHNSLKPLEGVANAYRFRIQVYDSPDGDVWWCGTCQFLNSDTDVEILTEGSERW